jgi:hypothetical protein
MAVDITLEGSYYGLYRCIQRDKANQYSTGLGIIVTGGNDSIPSKT